MRVRGVTPPYRDRRVEGQRRWPEALFRRLATLPTSDFVPFRFFPLNYETIVDIRDAKWFIYKRMPLYPSISIIIIYTMNLDPRTLIPKSLGKLKQEL